ncbi:hypothetical protein [Lusitaniella coriacea]|uniref:hypothetical protein n=1 Tax=Lusitaniella coriacea TaxID=1983105 RepID=UPI003CE9021D
MTVMKTSKERKKSISKISHASGIAQYALAAKMSDEQITKAAKHLDILSVIKSANNYNRYCQSQKTAEANQKLKQFMNIENSEIYKAGQWLLHSLSNVGQERKESLLEKELIHKEDYNQTVEDLNDVISEQKQGVDKQTVSASESIKNLEDANDSFRYQLQAIKDYIENNYDAKTWSEIEKYIHRN